MSHASLLCAALRPRLLRARRDGARSRSAERHRALAGDRRRRQRRRLRRAPAGLAFGVADAKTFEAVYFRPFRFADDDPAARSHAVQYVAWPEYTWEKLRKDKPGVYEAAIRPIPDPAGWFHARIEVTPQKVRVWVDAAKEPCLVVDRLAHQKGDVGLWVDSKPGAFRNLRIHPAP